MKKKKTYGQVVIDHIQEGHALDDDVIEYRRRMEGDLSKKIYATAQEAKLHTLYANKDFFVVLLIKVERLGGVPRTYVFARQSCPTPIYKQSVWKYHHKSDSLEFLWSIPDAILYHHILRNMARYLEDKECAQLARFVVLMERGYLLDWVKKENGEKDDAIIKITPEVECLVN